MVENILINIGTFAPNGEFGGVSVYIYNVYSELLKKGYNIHIIIKNYDDTYFSIAELSNQGFNVHIIPQPETFFGHVKYFLMSMIESKKIVKQFKIDIIHANHIFEGVSGAIVSIITGVPLVCTFHGGWFETITWKIKKIIRFCVSMHAEKIIILNKSQELEFKKWFAKKTVLIPTGVNAAEFVMNVDTSRIRSKYLKNPDQRILLTVSILNKRKNVDLLIRSFANIEAKANALLIIIGDGPEKKSLEVLAQELSTNIIFTGKLPRNEIIELLITADLFVLTSKMEGLPLVILEAMSAGTPTMSTPVGGIPELITDGFNGYLVNFNQDEIGRKILYFLSNQNEGETIIKNAHELIQKKYTWKCIAEQVNIVYTSIRA